MTFVKSAGVDAYEREAIPHLGHDEAEKLDGIKLWQAQNFAPRVAGQPQEIHICHSGHLHRRLEAAQKVGLRAHGKTVRMTPLQHVAAGTDEVANTETYAA